MPQRVVFLQQQQIPMVEADIGGFSVISGGADKASQVGALPLVDLEITLYQPASRRRDRRTLWRDKISDPEPNESYCFTNLVDGTSTYMAPLRIGFRKVDGQSTAGLKNAYVMLRVRKRRSFRPTAMDEVVPPEGGA